MKYGNLIAVLLVFWTFEASGQQQKEVEDDDFCLPEQEASFPGGYDSLTRYIKNVLRLPACSAEHVKKVFIEFSVNEDGSLSDFKILKGHCVTCDKSVIELVKKMPAWIPAQSNGAPVKTRCIVPVCY